MRHRLRYADERSVFVLTGYLQNHKVTIVGQPAGAFPVVASWVSSCRFQYTTSLDSSQRVAYQAM